VKMENKDLIKMYNEIKNECLDIGIRDLREFEMIFRIKLELIHLLEST